MRIAMATVFAAATVAATVVSSQTPSRPRSANGPTFDVISIRPHPEDGPVSNVVYQRPDGGFSLTALPASHLIIRAYALDFGDDIVGLPEWAKSERYDVSATSSLSQATTDERLGMWRAMLVDRFRLVAHLEKRIRPAYDLVRARRDGRLGPGLTRVALACEAEPCAMRVEPHGSSRFGLLLAGETTLAALATQLRATVQRPVVDKTGLHGRYRVRLIYDDMASRLGLEAASWPDLGPSLSTAVREQLGLRLRSSTAAQDTLVVDHIERPTEN